MDKSTGNTRGLCVFFIMNVSTRYLRREGEVKVNVNTKREEWRVE